MTITKVEETIAIAIDALDHLAVLSIDPSVTQTDLLHILAMKSLMEIMVNRLAELCLSLPESQPDVDDLIATIEMNAQAIKTCET